MPVEIIGMSKCPRPGTTSMWSPTSAWFMSWPEQRKQEKKGRHERLQKVSLDTCSARSRRAR